MKCPLYYYYYYIAIIIYLSNIFYFFAVIYFYSIIFYFVSFILYKSQYIKAYYYSKINERLKSVNDLKTRENIFKKFSIFTKNTSD